MPSYETIRGPFRANAFPRNAYICTTGPILCFTSPPTLLVTIAEIVMQPGHDLAS